MILHIDVCFKDCGQQIFLESLECGPSHVEKCLLLHGSLGCVVRIDTEQGPKNA